MPRNPLTSIYAPQSTLTRDQITAGNIKGMTDFFGNQYGKPGLLGASYDLQGNGIGLDSRNGETLPAPEYPGQYSLRNSQAGMRKVPQEYASKMQNYPQDLKDRDAQQLSDWNKNFATSPHQTTPVGGNPMTLEQMQGQPPAAPEPIQTDTNVDGSVSPRMAAATELHKLGPTSYSNIGTAPGTVNVTSGGSTTNRAMPTQPLMYSDASGGAGSASITPSPKPAEQPMQSIQQQTESFNSTPPAQSQWDQNLRASQPKQGEQNFAVGGMVRGPGTTTSDSIPAKLSDGEYIIPADVVRYYGTDKLDKMVEKVGGMRHPIENKDGVLHAAQKRMTAGVSDFTPTADEAAWQAKALPPVEPPVEPADYRYMSGTRNPTAAPVGAPTPGGPRLDRSAIYTDPMEPTGYRPTVPAGVKPSLMSRIGGMAKGAGVIALGSGASMANDYLFNRVIDKGAFTPEATPEQNLAAAGRGAIKVATGGGYGVQDILRDQASKQFDVAGSPAGQAYNWLTTSPAERAEAARNKSPQVDAMNDPTNPLSWGRGEQPVQTNAFAQAQPVASDMSKPEETGIADQTMMDQIQAKQQAPVQQAPVRQAVQETPQYRPQFQGGMQQQAAPNYSDQINSLIAQAQEPDTSGGDIDAQFRAKGRRRRARELLGEVAGLQGKSMDVDMANARNAQDQYASQASAEADAAKAAQQQLNWQAGYDLDAQRAAETEAGNVASEQRAVAGENRAVTAEGLARRKQLFAEGQQGTQDAATKDKLRREAADRAGAAQSYLTGQGMVKGEGGNYSIPNAGWFSSSTPSKEQLAELQRIQSGGTMRQPKEQN